MQHALTSKNLIVKPSKIHGYGVFADEDIAAGEVIEECYFITTTELCNTLIDYGFYVGDKFAILLGYGSIYNHSDEPNCIYDINAKTSIATLTAKSAIKKGDEIYVSYGETWFKSRGRVPKQKRWQGLKSFAAMVLRMGVVLTVLLIVLCVKLFKS